MSKLYDLVEQFVVASFIKVDLKNSITHFKRTAYWVKQLKPNADEALLIAAVAHDIERAFKEQKILKEQEGHGFTNKDFLRHHEEKGSEIIEDFLKKQNARDEIIKRVKMLVSRHETGGNEDQNILKDADSISFFENNISHFLNSKLQEAGKEKVREKFSWMFNRITSDKAKKIAKPWYDQAIKDLESK